MTNNLHRLFRPRSVAILGASEKNPWTGMALNVLRAIKFQGPIHLVNRRGGMVLGRTSVTSAAAITEPVDAAFVLVPAHGLYEALEEMAAANIRFGAVISSGLAENGAEGAAEQARIFARAQQLGLTLLGPNSLGFINYVDRVALGTLAVPTPILPQPRVAVVSQSGATAIILTRTAERYNVSLTHAVALGNEASIGLHDVIDFLIDDESTRSLAVFAESIRDPARFLLAARRALAARKPIVMLKVGVGELAAAVAQAHTGALVGNDRIFTAACNEYGIVRVATLEELITTADFLAFTGVLPQGKKFAVSSISGGACEMMADLGDACGVPFARFDHNTIERLRHELPGYGTAHNPLDVTGAAMADPDLFRRSILAMAPDPEVGLIAVCFELPATEGTTLPVSRGVLTALAQGLAQTNMKGFLLQQTMQTITPYARELANELGVPYFASGIGLAMKSVAAAFAWSDKVRAGRADSSPSIAPITARPVTERQTLEVLQAAGIPVVPAKIARSRAEAIAAQRDIAAPVALKILSPDIQHKTDAGGVTLNVSATGVGDAYDAMMARVRAALPTAQIEGVTVSPMRMQGLELFVGVARDPAWGLAIAVGLGGVLVELLQDSALRLLPVTPHTVKAMLQELRGAKLLNGYRGAPPADIDTLARVIASIGDAALAFGAELASLEINPLWVHGDRVECLDALAVWHA